MILDSTKNILWSCQKWFWIPLKLFYGQVRIDGFGVIIHIVWLYLESKIISDVTVKYFEWNPKTFLMWS